LTFLRFWSHDPFSAAVPVAITIMTSATITAIVRAALHGHSRLLKTFTDLAWMSNKLFTNDRLQDGHEQDDHGDCDDEARAEEAEGCLFQLAESTVDRQLTP
jgi:hypothetical protein